MEIEFLKLRNYRNYEKLDIHFHSKVNIFTGKNGIGKSNLLEALQYSLSGRSFRLVQNLDVIKKNSLPNVGQIQAQVSNKNTKKNIKIRFDENKKEIVIDEKKAGAGALRVQFSSVVFSPESLSIVKQGPQERRLLIDEIAVCFHKEKVALLNNYQRCVKTRNRVLKDFSEGKIDANETSLIIQSINPNFISMATELVFLRLETIKTLSTGLKNAFSCFFSKTPVDILVDYVISGKSAIDWSQNQVYDTLKLRLVELQEAELSSGQTLVGPHKHDVRFLFNGQDARTFCSQGQQRSIILAVKIAQIIKHYELHGEYPVLLLDDVFSELDLEKRESLMKLLNDSQAQIFLTMTELDEQLHFNHKDVKVFEMDSECTR